ncbi:flagellar motor switch phosphatase FliY [Ornithinibacillus sp. L9]|uniref:Flagellar motor switch phosphatase FliY n=1 Tax=Ornithinibacillus caprae TaxID=2678566 RepID=A0A6N8FKB1_9BACI|nr:flagellar motor switch phosphatase FliY [Ornithinibacillus caprae]MUK89905.1 flagellar motor switch phosphatase FliY [Ornithinibacillus caprae]
MMNDGMLSQDEIDALLNVGGNDEEDNESNQTAEKETLSSIEEDTLGEIGNISFGSSATTLSTLLNQKVEITTPMVSVISRQELNNEFQYPHVGIEVNYVEGFTGVNVFVIKTEDAAVISDIMLGGDGTGASEELNDIHLSAVQEAMNQMMGAAATSMSTVFEKKVDISPPSISVNQVEESLSADSDEELFVKVSFQLKVGTLIDSNIMQVIPIDFAKHLVESLSKESEEEVAAAVEQLDKPLDVKVDQEQKVSVKQDQKEEESNPQFIGNSVANDPTNIQQADFSNFNQVELNQNEQRNLDMLLDIPLKVTVELGRTNRSIRDILDLSAGSIIELDKLAGEPVDILVNEKLIAKGEVVVIDENFGVRVTDIISQSDRLLKLK